VFDLAGNTPDGHVITYSLDITDSNGGPWTDSFTVTVICSTPPYTPSNPVPSHESTGITVTTDLSWTGGDPDSGDTVTYTVYFGTSSPLPLLSCDDVFTPTCDPPGPLSESATYYWYVVATDNHDDSTTGPTWNFQTTDS
jgi:hypothetical protein